jgi:hypothetical protein
MPIRGRSAAMTPGFPLVGPDRKTVYFSESAFMMTPMKRHQSETCMRVFRVRRCLAAGSVCLGLLGVTVPAVQARQVLTVAAFPAVDEIVRAAIPAWKPLHTHVEIKVVSRQFGHHHTAMTTAPSTSSQLPDVIALEVGYLGRFAQGSAFEDLSKPPHDTGEHRHVYFSHVDQQAINRRDAVK